jgi:serine O-acetyltransferase
MVGNPARQVGRRSAAGEAPPVFEPYGITSEIPDPIARALNGLLDEVSMLRTRLGEVERAREAEPPGDGSAPAPVRRRAARAQP